MSSEARKQLRVLVALGVMPTRAVQAALGEETLSEFAARRGINRSMLSDCLHGRMRAASVREALAEEFGLSRQWVDEWLDRVRAERQDTVSTSR